MLCLGELFKMVTDNDRITIVVDLQIGLDK